MCAHHNQIDVVDAGVARDLVRWCLGALHDQDRACVAVWKLLLELPERGRFVVARIRQHGAQEHVVGHVKHVEGGTGGRGLISRILSCGLVLMRNIPLRCGLFPTAMRSVLWFLHECRRSPAARVLSRPR